MSEENFICSFLVSDDDQCNRWGGGNQVFFYQRKNRKAISLKKRDVSPRKVQNLLRSPAAKLISFGSKVIAKVKFFSKVKVKVKSQIVWYGQKGLVTRNQYVKYESLISFDSKVISKVNFFQK